MDFHESDVDFDNCSIPKKKRIIQHELSKDENKIYKIIAILQNICREIFIKKENLKLMDGSSECCHLPPL